MRILYIVSSVSRIWGGVSIVVQDSIPYLLKNSLTVEVYTTKKNRAGIPEIKFDGVPTAAYPVDLWSHIWPAHSWQLRRALSDSIASFDLIHIHELWHYPAYIAAREALRQRIPYIITVHGELEPWALKYRGLKKKIYYRLIQRKQLNSAATIQCLTEDEAIQVRKCGVTAPISVIPNGIVVRNSEKIWTQAEIHKKFPEFQDKLLILFLGRIHRIKGLDRLIGAFGRIVQKYGNTVILVIAGSNDGYEMILRKMITGLGIDAQVLFTGPVTGRDKDMLLARADLFVLPSYSEGFSISILEAMAAGVPVIISDRCHFPEVRSENAGFVISNDTNQIYEALDRLLTDPELRRAMGTKGKRLVQEKYAWDAVAKRLIGLYQSLV